MDAEFIEAEKEDLATHVDSCSRRYVNLRTRLTRIEAALWAIILLLIGGGWVTIEKLIPIARALAGVP